MGPVPVLGGSQRLEDELLSAAVRAFHVSIHAAMRSRTQNDKYYCYMTYIIYIYALHATLSDTFVRRYPLFDVMRLYCNTVYFSIFHVLLLLIR